MEIITGYRGEPHITSAQDRAANQGCFGEGSYILDVGSKLEPEIISANEIRINDGVLSHQGCVANIALGTYDSLTIANGSQGMKRADLIVARYTRDSETLVEDIELVVIEGTPASGTPSLPSYNEGDIQAGDSPVDMPLFRVNLDGISIDSVDQIAANVMTQAEIDTKLNSLLFYDTVQLIFPSIAIGAAATQEAIYDTPPGYKLLCVVRHYTGSSTVSCYNAYQKNGTQNTYVGSVRNIVNIALTNVATYIGLLFIKI